MEAKLNVVMLIKFLKKIFEFKREKIGKFFMKKYDRLLTLDEMLLDRWKKAKLIGCGKNTNVYEHALIFGKPKIGENVWIGPFTIIDGSGGLEIGDGCDISAGVHIYTHTTVKRCVSKRIYNKIDKKPVRIGNYVFIGANATVLAGVKIGDYSVIGAGAVVNKDIPPYSIVAGVPAKVIGKVRIKNGEIKFIYNKRRRNEFRKY